MNNSVLAITNSNRSVLGTGFVVKKDDNGIYVVTCGHVVKKCGDLILVNGQTSSVDCNEYDSGLDLAILYVAGLDLEPFNLSLVGDSNVKVIGYSKIVGNNKKETISNISVKEDIQVESYDYIKLYPEEDISDGYSGSPVICQSTGSVVGMVAIKSGSKNYAISSKALSKFIGVEIESHCNSKKIKLCTKLDEVKRGIISKKISDNFENALASFSSQKNIWVTPHLDRNSEEKSGNSEKFEISKIIDSPSSIVIRARQQYGATSLSHFLIKEAWFSENQSFWIYLDSTKLKPYKKEIDKEVNRVLDDLSLIYADIECVVVDEFSATIKDGNKLLFELSEYFKGKPIVLMYSFDETPLVNQEIDLPRDFSYLYLWSLDRRGVRVLVNGYNSERVIAEDTRVLNKVVNDLEALNIPRTPQNCLTILKISEYKFDDSPVNRAEMITRVLQLLFNVDDIPNYKTRPDLKDTEFTLGYFCEKIIRSRKIYFTRNEFIEILTRFCSKNEIDLEIYVIFDILSSNNIIVSRNEGFCFKFTYWVYYFAAHRMLHDSEFCNYILADSKYINYPELIEFYTGVDRRRNNAIEIISNDLVSIERIVNSKCGLPEDFEVYNLAKWLPSESQLEVLEKEITDGVAASSLPDEVKDDYADRDYSRIRPLSQNINYILEEYSLLRLIQSIKSGSLALRNSDFVDKDLKHKLLSSILQGVKQLVNVMVVLSPILARHDQAEVEGANFELHGPFSDKLDEKFNQIICCIPSNMINWYVDELFTQKMGTLVNNKICDEKDDFKLHYLHLMLISKRPKDWEVLIEKYILEIDKNSFYLLDIIRSLKAEYMYSYASSNSLNKIGILIKLCTGKHERLLKKINVKKAQRLSDNILPKRKAL